MARSELFKHKNWAVVGDVLNQEKYAFKIVKKLREEGYLVFGVNPRSASPDVYRRLKDVIPKIDVIDLVINPKTGLEVMKEAKELGIDKVLIQPGAESEEILQFCRENGITVLESCVLRELDRE